jgi:hypothetical protein
LHENEFRLVAQGILNKYDGTPLLSRWQEAVSFGTGLEATDYWIRDSGGIVNIVWLNSDGIRDITMIHQQGILEDSGEEELGSDEADGEGASIDEEGSYEVPTESMFNFMPLRSINSVEVREGQHIAFRMGIGASGNKLVHLIPNVGAGNIGHLYWVADSPSEAEELEHFLNSVLSAYISSR